MKVTAKQSGDFNALRSALDKAARGDFTAQCAEYMADRTVMLIEREFASGTSPSGSAWAPVVRGGSPLVLTGALSSSWVSVIARNAFGASSGIDYGQFHQTGTSRMVARVILPEDSIPPAWQDEFDSLASAVFDMFFAGSVAA